MLVPLNSAFGMRFIQPTVRANYLVSLTGTGYSNYLTDSPNSITYDGNGLRALSRVGGDIGPGRFPWSGSLGILNLNDADGMLRQTLGPILHSLRLKGVSDFGRRVSYTSVVRGDGVWVWCIG